LTTAVLPFTLIHMNTPVRVNKEATVKTTVALPESLWRATKMRAIEERTDLRRIIIAALEAYLSASKTGKGKEEK
jgi:hypothetical protein